MPPAIDVASGKVTPWRTPPGLILAAALLSAIPVWWMIAIPVLGGAADPIRRHLGHFPWVYAHAAGGTVMLFSGAAALWIGWTRQGFRFHRWVGGAYLTTGTLTAGAALWLTATNVHHEVAISAPTGTLAAAWLLTAAMGFRAIRNKRIDTHRQWVIRSYVLTWSFVFCRGLGLMPMKLGQDTVVALLWLTWIGPLLICEAALQWQAGAKATPRRQT